MTPTGISNYDRYIREIQGVECRNDIIAIDWTFAVSKTYRLPGAAAAFTMNTGTGEIAALGLVENTAVDQIAHLVEQVKRRQHFDPSVIYTDTWPKSENFWHTIFGAITGRLGLYHFMQRTISTLRKSHPDFWKALVAFQKCIYRYDDNDHEALLSALMSGKMGRDGKCWSESEIDSLRHSKRWKQRYSKFLRKIPFGANMARNLMDEWWIAFKCENSEGRPVGGGRRNPITDETLFTEATLSAFTEQKKNVQYVGDPPNINIYRTLPPSPNSTHGLSEQISNTLII